MRVFDKRAHEELEDGESDFRGETID